MASLGKGEIAEAWERVTSSWERFVVDFEAGRVPLGVVDEVLEELSATLEIAQASR
jgi:hypothetical protein